MLVIFILNVNISFAAVTKIIYSTQQFKLSSYNFDVVLPKNYQLELVLELDRPRIISISKKGEMFIGSKSGYLYRLSSPYNKVIKLVKLNNYPHSVVVRNNFIYIAQTNGLYRAPYKFGQRKISINSVVKYISLPGGYGHNSRTIRLGLDNKLYLSLGLSGNCSNQFIGKSYPLSQQRGGVVVLNEKNKLQWLPFATGLRNPVGYDWHPKSGMMYASNNGPDHWGFNLPREYFSKLTPDSFHGMPWFQVINDKITKDKCIKTISPLSEKNVHKPVQTFDARNAPMAVAFIINGPIAKKHYGDAVVALHGSWAVPEKGKLKASKAGRRKPKLVLVRFDNGVSIRVDDFVTGFQLKNGSRWARPVGVINAPDGSIYFTSDGGINGLFRIKKIKK
ncbi:MAG: sorbosone dehydrogenase family protein [Thiohalomonadales bacterium]